MLDHPAIVSSLVNDLFVLYPVKTSTIYDAVSGSYLYRYFVHHKALRKPLELLLTPPYGFRI